MATCIYFAILLVGVLAPGAYADCNENYDSCLKNWKEGDTGFDCCDCAKDCGVENSIGCVLSMLAQELSVLTDQTDPRV